MNQVASLLKSSGEGQPLLSRGLGSPWLLRRGWGEGRDTDCQPPLPGVAWGSLQA